MNDLLLVLSVIVLTALLLLLTWARLRRGVPVGLRPHPAYRTLRYLMGRSVESGRRLHMTPGRGALHSPQGPAGVAGLLALEELAKQSSDSGVAPVVSVGAATLLSAAQGTVRRAYATSGRVTDFHLRDTHFLADRAYPFVFAAGATLLAQQPDVESSVALGHLGAEMGLLAEGGRRRDAGQILGSDDPVASAVATAFTPNAVWGEELFAAPAYLQRSPLQLASLRTQDILRWLAALGILGIAALRMLGILG
ncbi:MAG: DUF6754 domain-containing protein [Anaerolineae bacterium]|nr:DUF6754 domain-containing protein [Anaerolineae bacterium]